MLLYQQLINGINEFLQDKVMSKIWPDDQEYDRQTVRDNIAKLSFEALGDVQRIVTYLENHYYKDTNDSSFIGEYPYLTKALQDDKDTGYAVADRAYDISLQSEDPFVYADDIIDMIEDEYHGESYED